MCENFYNNIVHKWQLRVEQHNHGNNAIFHGISKLLFLQLNSNNALYNSWETQSTQTHAGTDTDIRMSDTYIYLKACLFDACYDIGGGNRSNYHNNRIAGKISTAGATVARLWARRWKEKFYGNIWNQNMWAIMYAFIKLPRRKVSCCRKKL